VPPLPPSAAEIALSTAAASATAETDASVPPTPKSTATPKSTSGKGDRTADEVKPFQRLQFLVRDWQNFDTDYEDGQDPAVFDALHEGMQKYLTDVLRSRGLGDLQSTREQITRCFEKLDCFMLPHPGFSVVKKNYDGAINKIDPFFRALVNKYVRILFDQELEAKVTDILFVMLHCWQTLAVAAS
jgi:hypothetical protein